MYSHHSFLDSILGEDEDLFEDYDIIDESDEESDAEALSNDEESDAEALSNDEGLDFDELKDVINNQFKKTNRSDFFLTSIFSQEQYTMGSTEFSEPKKSTKKDKDSLETTHTAVTKKLGFFNEKDFYNRLIEEGIKEEEQKQQAIMKKRLTEIQATFAKIRHSFKKIAFLHKDMERFYHREGYAKKILRSPDAIEEQQKKEFADYILLEMAGINNKASQTYEDLSSLHYLTLLIQMNKFLRKHPLKHYTCFKKLQNDFIKHLYHRALKTKELPEYAFNDIFIHPSQKEEIELKPSEVKEIPPQREEMTAREEARRVHGILDRINQILLRILHFLYDTFCFSQQEQADHELHLLPAPR